MAASAGAIALVPLTEIAFPPCERHSQSQRRLQVLSPPRHRRFLPLRTALAVPTAFAGFEPASGGFCPCERHSQSQRRLQVLSLPQAVSALANGTRSPNGVCRF
ncbi:MAG: hypothetical protein LBT01_09010 [Spirochaetaceae bacterium]|nr:hypothetical protein [Spirochaetaceae bacterium]